MNWEPVIGLEVPLQLAQEPRKGLGLAPQRLKLQDMATRGTLPVAEHPSLVFKGIEAVLDQTGPQRLGRGVSRGNRQG